MDNPRINIQMLGRFEIRTSLGVNLLECRSAKPLSVLQFLMARHDQTVTPGTLWEEIWPNQPVDPKSSALRVAIHTLRRELGEGVEINRNRYGYALAGGTFDIDSELFSKKIHEAETADDASAKRQAYEAATKLYAGDFLPGSDLLWVEQWREWYRRRMLEALAWLRDDAAAFDDRSAVLSWASWEVTLDPTSESAYQALVNVHIDRGELGQAYNWLSVCKEQLARIDAPVSQGLSRLCQNFADTPEMALG